MAKKTKDETVTLKTEVAELKKEIKYLKSKLSMSQSAFLNIVGKSLDGVLIVDQKKMVVYTNYAAIKLFDRNIADLLGEPLTLDFNPTHLSDDHESMAEIHIPKADGSEAITEVSVLKTEWNNEPCHVLSFRDITERKKTQEQLEHSATHDYLTNLPNRNYFEKQIDKAIQFAKDTDQYMAVIYLDLDNFKIINDTLGHAVGDLLLKEISIQLLNSVRSGDTVARLGGDEFALILGGLTKPEYAATVSQTILNKLANISEIDSKEIYINASIGIAVYPHNGTTAEEIIKNADMAMYVSKQYGKHQYQYFSADLDQENEKNLQIINGLRNVVRNHELRLHYQPIIDLSNNTCCGVEALLRWEHPKLGLMYPDQFLLIAEKMGFISDIGQWVMNQSLEDLPSFDDEKLLFMSINMSANEFMAIEVERIIFSCLQKQHIPAQKLVIELTEKAIISHLQAIIIKLKYLTDGGVKIAIDDYGTGYSSLSLLKQLPISIMKIDRSFTADIGDDYNDMVIIKSTIKLAHSLGLKVIAEGVETKEQLDFLREHSCDYVQGFYFSKPLEINALIKYIHRLNG